MLYRKEAFWGRSFLVYVIDLVQVSTNYIILPQAFKELTNWFRSNQLVCKKNHFVPH